MNAIDFSPEELTAFREELFPGFSDTQFNLAISECKRRNLVPGQHIYFQLRNAKEWDPTLGASVATKKLTKVTTIDAFRLISQRTGEYAGQGKAKFYYLDTDNAPSIVSEIPLPHPELANTPREPWACSVPIYRKGFIEPVEVVCRFDAYAVTRKSGNGTVLTDMWVRRGPEQLSKCSEAASRRVAFAEELGSLYLSEEFAKEDAESAPSAPVADTPVVAAPKAPTVPKVNHVPAVATDEARPGEPRDAVFSAILTAPYGTGVTEAMKPRIEDVILDRPATPAPVQKLDKPEKVKKPTAKEKTEAILEASYNDMMGAIDQKIAEVRDPENRLPNAEEKAANAKILRGYIDGGANKDLLKAYILKESGQTDMQVIVLSQWNSIFTKLAAAGSKEAVNQLIAPVTEEEAF